LICTLAREAILKIPVPAPLLGPRERLQGLADAHLGQFLPIVPTRPKNPLHTSGYAKLRRGFHVGARMVVVPGPEDHRHVIVDKANLCRCMASECALRHARRVVSLYTEPRNSVA
jgi:hypothetical protein